MQTALYIVRRESKLSCNGEKIFLEDDSVSKEIPIMNVKSVNVFVHIDISSQVIQLCLQNDIPMYFVSPYGKYLWKLQALQNTSIERRVEQYHTFLHADTKQTKAQEIVNGKIKNSLAFLYRQRRLNYFECSEEINNIIAMQNSLAQCETLQEMRWKEWIVARYYFKALWKALPPDFWFAVRSRRPPKDKTNSLLSFGYTLLANNILTAIELQGLDSTVGFLHEPIRNTPALVLDMMEEFRSIIVDHLVCFLLISETITLQDFDETGEFPLLTNEGRKKFLLAYEKRLHTQITWNGYTMTFLRLFEYQAEQMKISIRDKTSYIPYSFR